VKSRLLPVIHVADQAQALVQTAVAREAGADGVWLINHSIPAAALWDIFCTVRKEHPDYWIGVNFLDLGTLEAMAWVCTTKSGAGFGSTLIPPNGLWADKSGVTDGGVSPLAKQVWALKEEFVEESGWGGEYFGGVAFKYQKAVNDWAEAAKLASPFMDVVTTSGPGTGIQASIDKIRWMSTGTKRLAIASGISPENIETYLPWASDFLVATGISHSFTELDPARTKALAEIIHAYEPATS